MDAMALDVSPPPQAACTADETRHLARLQRDFARLSAHMAEIGGVFDEIVAVVDALSAHVRELRRLRAGPGASAAADDLAERLREVEGVFARVAAVARKAEAARGGILEVARTGFGGAAAAGVGGGETVDALAAAMQRIHIDLSH
ncbi:hypothetical protein ACP4OV_006588 [Aristida adscensionis]